MSLYKLVLSFSLLYISAGFLLDGNSDLATIVHHLQADLAAMKSQQIQDSIQIKGLVAELTEKEILIDQLKDEIATIQEIQANCTASIGLQNLRFLEAQANLTTELEVQKLLLQDVSEKFEQHEREITNLTNSDLRVIYEIQTEVEDLRNATVTYENYGTELEQFKTYVKSKFGRDETEVAFLARFEGDEILAVRNMSVLFFNYVSLNIGNAYNVTSGVFTAPVRGLYLFQLTVKSNDTDVQIDIHDENGYYGTVGGTGYNKQGATNAMIYLNVGDHIWAQNVHQNVNVFSLGFTQFSGVLIQAD